MTLSSYHQKYSSYSDEEIQKRANEKEVELQSIFEKISLITEGKIVRLAVMGSGDKRFVKHHQRIFEKFVKKAVEVTTFDITVAHLAGEENITQHDCTLPLPNTPYDITYAHVLLKFIPTGKQFNLIKNSIDALNAGGIAIHVLDKEDYETKEPLLSDGYFSVPLDRWKKQLEQMGMEYKEISVKYGLALVIIKK